MRILIGADVVATETNKDYFINDHIHDLIGSELFDEIESADALVFNIEAPITDEWTPIKKAGSPKANLKMPEKVIKGYKSLNPTLVTLANNHIMDQGEKGYSRTVELLDKYNIPYSGVGKTLQDAKKPYFITMDDVRVGFYCCAEHEFSIATSTTPGANPFDSLTSLDDIYEAKRCCDYLVVLYHGGRECYRYPSPDLQRKFRRMADKGADLVIAQHTHCIGCAEDYNNSKLIYGQGNFIFDLDNNEYWNTGLLIDLILKKNDQVIIADFNYIPFKKINSTIRMAKDAERDNLIREFYNRSDEIKQNNFIEKTYNKYSEENLTNLIRVIHGDTFLFRLINKFLRLFGYNDYIFKKYKGEKLLGVLNYIECEAHSELLIKGIRKKYNL